MQVERALARLQQLEDGIEFGDIAAVQVEHPQARTPHFNEPYRHLAHVGTTIKVDNRQFAPASGYILNGYEKEKVSD